MNIPRRAAMSAGTTLAPEGSDSVEERVLKEEL
jgi:hypothetical protein